MGAGQHAFLLIGQTHKKILDPVLERKTKDRTDEDGLYKRIVQDSKERMTRKQHV